MYNSKGERFEEERRYRFYQTISVLLTPNTLFDWEAEPAQKESANAFRAGLLRLICGGAGDRVDMWISDRLEIGLENARRLANAGNGAAALEQIESFVTLLEQTNNGNHRRTNARQLLRMDGRHALEGQRILEEQI